MKQSQAEALALSLSTMLDTKGSVGLKIARNLRMINDELKEYYQFKQELFEKYGEEIDGHLAISKDSPNIGKFLEELKPLDDQEVNFNFRMITEDELIDSGLSARQIGAIWDIVEERSE